MPKQCNVILCCHHDRRYTRNCHVDDVEVCNLYAEWNERVGNARQREVNKLVDAAKKYLKFTFGHTGRANLKELVATLKAFDKENK